jgi:predicted TPR repeat methyltransferase
MAHIKRHQHSDALERAQALVAAGEAQAAVALLRAQLESGGGLLTRLALGRALLAANEIPQALEELREAAALAPGIPDAVLALGEALLAAGHLPTAIAELQRALRLDPGCKKAQYTLGCAWLEAGETAQARDVLATLATSASPLAACAAEKILEAEAMQRAQRASPGYVRHLFDQFSADYDQRMLDVLSYRAHLILRELAELVISAPGNSLAVLDLGCGTGLAGEAFRDLAKRLDGVDLSPRMIERAREREIYDELWVGDLEIALQRKKRRYDLIVAADTLVYLGDLSGAFAAASSHLRPNGYFLFTVEAKAGEGFELGPKRRYRHSEAYLREQAACAGLDVMGLVACTPRNEANAPVEGLALALQPKSA